MPQSRPIFLPFDEARVFNLAALHWWLMNPVATVHATHRKGGSWVGWNVYTKDDLNGYIATYTRHGSPIALGPWYIEWHDMTNDISAEQMAEEIYGAIPHCLVCEAESIGYDPEEEGPLCFCGFKCNDIYYYGKVMSS